MSRHEIGLPLCVKKEKKKREGGRALWTYFLVALPAKSQECRFCFYLSMECLRVKTVQAITLVYLTP